MIAKFVRAAVKAYSKTLHPFVPKGAKPFLRSVYGHAFGKVMEREATDGICRFYSGLGIVQPGELVFDIGANRGAFAEAFLRLGARVVCVEPDPRCVEMLRARFKGNGNVAIVDAGAGEEEGFLTLEMGSMDGNATFSKEFKALETTSYSGNYVKSAKARITTLDKLIAEHGTPKYCKVDVEGFEQQVFRGLHQKIPYLSFEFHREALDEAKLCAKQLSALGKAEFNYTHYDPAKPAFEHAWMGADEMFAAIESEDKEKTIAGTGDINTWRVGDIFVKIA